MNRFDSSLSLRGLLSGENAKPTILLVWAPLILTTWKYYGTRDFYWERLASWLVLFSGPGQTAELYTNISAFVLLGVLSLLVINLVFRDSAAGYGLQLGDWRFGLKAVAVLAPVMVLLSYLSAGQNQFLAEYPLYKGACESAARFSGHAFVYLLYYAGWELFFRGLLQFGLRARLGDWNAILVQTGLSCLAHIGKPDGEIYSAILGGLVFGIVAFRSRSILYVLLIHWILGASLDLFICLR